MAEICDLTTPSMLSVEQARTNIGQLIQPLEQQERVLLQAALGRVLRQDAISAIDIPPQRNSAMDGYACLGGDLYADKPNSLQVAGTAWAGKPFTGQAAPGQCVRIFTGAPVPDFADSVVAQEQVRADGGNITIPAGITPYKNIREAGSDAKRHETLISAPKQLQAADLGLLAAAGIGQASVTRRIKIGFFSTGDELAPIGQALQPGQIYDSNRYLLAGLLQDPNHDFEDLGAVKDDPEQLHARLADAAKRYDVLISTGGASVGDADYVGQTLARCGEIHFWKLAIKPGKPLAFGRIGNCWFFGLPGNPVAVLVTYQQFVRPALRQLAGLTPGGLWQLRARCETPLRKTPGRREYQRGILRQTAPGEFSVSSAGRQDSHQLKTTSQANCFIVLDSECSGVQAGETVTVEPFDAWDQQNNHDLDDFQ